MNAYEPTLIVKLTPAVLCSRGAEVGHTILLQSAVSLHLRWSSDQYADILGKLSSAHVAGHGAAEVGGSSVLLIFMI